jgi:predicted membrane protein
MTSHALRHYPAAGDLPRWLLVGFVSGAVCLLIFQGALGLLHALALSQTGPVWSLAFWGGIWGALLATPASCRSRYSSPF